MHYLRFPYPPYQWMIDLRSDRVIQPVIQSVKYIQADDRQSYIQTIARLGHPSALPRFSLHCRVVPQNTSMPNANPQQRPSRLSSYLLPLSARGFFFVAVNNLLRWRPSPGQGKAPRLYLPTRTIFYRESVPSLSTTRGSCVLIIKTATFPHPRLFQQPAEGLGTFREAGLLCMGRHGEWTPKATPE